MTQILSTHINFDNINICIYKLQFYIVFFKFFPKKLNYYNYYYIVSAK